MSDVEARLRETLEAVAEKTTVAALEDPVLEPTVSKPRGRTGVLVAGFAFVIFAIGGPALIGLLSGDDAGNTIGPGPTAIAPVSIEPEFVIDPDWFVASQADVEAVGNHSLRSNVVWCLYEGSPGQATRARDLPVSSDATLETYTTDCIVYGDGRPEVLPETLTVCRGVWPASTYDQFFSDDEYHLRSGQPGNGPGFPVVLGWESDCVSEKLETNPHLLLTDDLDVDLINRIRRLEIALVAASYSNCWTYQQAMAVADEAKAILGDQWVRLEMPALAGHGDCFEVLVDIDWAWVWVAGSQRDEGPVTDQAGQTSTTLPPTTTITWPSG